MKFTTYADVLTSEHPMGRAYAAGHKKNPGALLRDVLQRNGGRYEVTIDLPMRFSKQLRELASITSDHRLSVIADSPNVTISLEHLRGLDPDATTIVYGCLLEREPTDGALPGFDL